MIDPRDEQQIGKVISENFQEAEMDATFRQSVLDLTRRQVSTHNGRKSVARRLLAGIAPAAIALALIFSITYHRAPSISVSTAAPERIAAPGADRPFDVMTGTKYGSGSSHHSSNYLKRGGSGLKTTSAFGSLGMIKKSIEQSDLVVMSVQSKATNSNGKGLYVGDHIIGTATIRTANNSRIALISKNGSQIYLDSSTCFSLHGDGTAEIKAGRIYCINRRGDFKSIQTPAANLKLLGTTLDAAVLGAKIAALTVVEGKVQATNSHGSALVSAGKRSVLVADASPLEGQKVNTAAETAWYDGRGKITSSTGQIAYTVRRNGGDDPLAEVWAMNGDGTNKHLVKTYIGETTIIKWLGGQRVLLDVNTVIWSTPDKSKRRADSGAGHPLVGMNVPVLLDTSTGQDARVSIPHCLRATSIAVSPDGSKMAFGASNVDGQSAEEGLWVFDVRTAEIRRVYKGMVATAPVWSPDSRMLLTSRGTGYDVEYPLAIVDTKTARIRDLGVQGVDRAFSPDGKKLAYCGGFRENAPGKNNKYGSGYLCVLDLGSGVSKKVSALVEGLIAPAWSPDGSRILYCADHRGAGNDFGKKSHFELFSVSADGSDQKLLFREQGTPRAFQWSADGNSIVLNSFYCGDSGDRNLGLHVIKSDGSGSLNIGGTEDDSILSLGVRSQMAGISKDVREGIFDYAMTKVGLFEGKLHEVISAKKTCAEIFSGLIWKYPKTQTSALNVMMYADTANGIPAKSDAEMITDSCKMRMDFLKCTIGGRFNRPFATDLQSLEMKLIGSGGGISWLFFEKDPQSVAWTHMMFRCPTNSTIFSYTPPTKDSKDTDVILSCPNHPQNKITLGDLKL